MKNVVLWIGQIVLAFLNFAGGAYKVMAYEELAKVPSSATLPQAGWAVIGVLEIVCAILLIVPAATKKMPWLTPLAAAVLTVEALALSGNHAMYSLDLAATNPLVWSASMAVIAGLVAWGRYALSPLTPRTA